MISNSDATIVVDNLGWVDRGALWIYDVREERERRLEIADADHLGIEAAGNDLFLLKHNIPALTVSLRAFDAPEVELASIRYEGSRWRFTGDKTLWRSADRAIVIQDPAGPQLFWMDPADDTVSQLDLSWFNAKSYDLGYQGIVDCLPIPATDQIWVSIQRSSTLIVMDRNTNQRVGQIELAGRSGNPRLRLLTGRRVLASDYDTLCVIDIDSQTTRETRLLQKPIGGRRHFVGDYDVRDSTCAVARTFSGDALLLDTESWAELARTRVEGQPLSMCLLKDGRFIARDWQTGHLSTGQF